MTAKGVPSVTARRVASYRLVAQRIPASFGDPAADEVLARDVAGEADGADSERLEGYLVARTAFFDRVVVNAIERGVTQIVNVGAGYDGRSLRYAKAGVRWWEIDQADTQADKHRRLLRLKLDAGDVSFVAHDLTEPGLADAVLAAGYNPEAAGLVICEGACVYLDDAGLRRLLGELRSLAAVGTRLVLAAPPASDDNERLRAAVAALGGRAVGSLTAQDVAELLGTTRWGPADVSERAQRAGFVVATPIWAPVSRDLRPTTGALGRFLEGMLHRAGTDTLASHLEATYTVPVAALRELDLGVFRVERADGTTWVARLFPAVRTVEAVRGDAATLFWLAAHDFPAERCADPQPVSVHDGQPVLVTELLSGRKAPANPTIFKALGRLLASLATLEPPASLQRPGGAWHHLVTDASLTDQKRVAIELFSAARSRVATADRTAYGTLAAGLDALDDLSDLPHGLVHPDPAPVNVIATETGPAFIDWTGAGWAPRLASLGCLLWVAANRGASCLDAAVAGYQALLQPDPAELSRLERAMTTSPLLLACWSFATGRRALDQTVEGWTRQERRMARAARRAEDRFANPRPADQTTS